MRINYRVSVISACTAIGRHIGVILVFHNSLAEFVPKVKTIKSFVPVKPDTRPKADWPVQDLPVAREAVCAMRMVHDKPNVLQFHLS